MCPAKEFAPYYSSLLRGDWKADPFSLLGGAEDPYSFWRGNVAIPCSVWRAVISLVN